MSAPPAIRCEDLAVSFQRWGQEVQALDGLGLEVPAGQWLLVVGPNGSGKSTLLRTLARRLTPQRGRVELFGRPLAEQSLAEAARRTFYVHQNPLLGTAPDLTVFENLAIADPAATGSRRERLERYGDLLEPLGLADRLRQPAGALSGGERQLLALLIAVLRPSELVLLDEPLAALDPHNAGLCLETIAALSRAGKTLVQVVHDLPLAVSTGHRTVALRDGRVAYDSAAAAERSAAVLQALWAPVGHE